jgi:hypothetical protein
MGCDCTPVTLTGAFRATDWALLWNSSPAIGHICCCGRANTNYFYMHYKWTSSLKQRNSFILRGLQTLA